MSSNKTAFRREQRRDEEDEEVVQIVPSTVNSYETNNISSAPVNCPLVTCSCCTIMENKTYRRKRHEKEIEEDTTSKTKK